MSAGNANTFLFDEPDFVPREELEHQEGAPDATQIYLKEIGFSPLLSPQEEVHFGRLARSGDAAGRALRECGRWRSTGPACGECAFTVPP